MQRMFSKSYLQTFEVCCRTALICVNWLPLIGNKFFLPLIMYRENHREIGYRRTYELKNYVKLLVKCKLNISTLILIE